MIVCYLLGQTLLFNSMAKTMQSTGSHSNKKSCHETGGFVKLFLRLVELVRFYCHIYLVVIRAGYMS